MIIARSLRISLGGGHRPGLLLSGSRGFPGCCCHWQVRLCYNYPSVHSGYLSQVFKQEQTELVAEIQHPIIREALWLLQLKTPQIELTTLADIPSGTGLGSSGSFTTALLKALFTHYHRPLQQEELAELACHIEIDKLQEPIGKQDQYIAAYGGITAFTFKRDGKVIAQPLQISMQTLFELEDHLLLFFTGFSRSADAFSRIKTRAPNKVIKTCWTICTMLKSWVTAAKKLWSPATRIFLVS